MQLLPDVADLQPGFFEAAVEFCGTQKSLKGFVGLIPAVKRNAEVEMEQSPAAVGFYGAVEQPGGFLMDAFDLGNQPEKVQNLGIFGNSFQNLAVQHFSFVKFAVLMKIDGAAKQ